MTCAEYIDCLEKDTIYQDVGVPFQPPFSWILDTFSFVLRRFVVDVCEKKFWILVLGFRF